MIVPVPLNLTIWQGKPWDMTFDWTLDAQPGPTVNGRMSLMRADTPSTKTVVASFATGEITFPLPGRIRIDLSAVKTAALAVGLYEWDYDAMDALGAVLGQVAVGKARVKVDP